MPDAAFAVSLIVPVHRGAPAFGRCLDAIANTAPPPAEVIVVCAGEAPEEVLRARAHGHRTIELSGACGPARARNAGAQAAQSPILFFVDSDVEVPPDIVSRVQEHFRQGPALTALIGSYDAAPSDPSFLSQYRNLLHHFVHQTSSEDASTFWGACGAIRRESFLEASGFDEAYRLPSVEDVELGYRLKRVGHRIRLDNTLQVKHLKRWDLRSMLRTDILHRALPWGTLILDRKSPARDLNLRPASQWSVVGIAVLLICLPAVAWYPALLALALAVALVLIALNLPFYRFLMRERGLWFTVRAIPSHWLFYACGGVGFGLAVLRHIATPIRGRPSG